MRPGLYTILVASFRRRCQELKRFWTEYLTDRLAIVGFIGGIMLFLPVYDNPVVHSRLETNEILPYLLIGAAFMPIYGIAIWEGVDQLQREIQSGIIDYTLSSPIRLYSYIVISIMVGCMFLVIDALPVFFAGVLLAEKVSGILPALLSVGVTLLLLVQVGIVMACLALVYPSIAPFTRFVNVVFQFLTGMLIPVLLLPGWLQDIAVLLPMTAGIDLARHYLTGSAVIWTIKSEWLIMLFETAVAAVLAGRMTQVFEKRLRLFGAPS